jgi:peptidoglycan/xylan/chitin deacetylase (PgdA/CDA1 family)
MKVVVAVIATLVALGVGALGMFGVQKFSPSAEHLPAGRNAPSAHSASALAPVAPDRLAQMNGADVAMVTTTDASDTSGTTCDKPGAMGLSRTVQIDTTGGPQLGAQHFKGHDFLRDREVVLTFDDGPRPVTTAAVLKALQDQCLKATFFEIGENVIRHPEITKQVIDAGMTVGTHTWSHKDLAKNPYAKDLAQTEQEIEMGNSAVHMAAAGLAVAPFFRFPDLQFSPLSLEYLAKRNVAMFSTDIDSRDFAMHKPEQVIKSVMDQLEKRGHGIILMHDSHRSTAEALPELLRQLAVAGYRIVHMVPKAELTTISKYDEIFDHLNKLSSYNLQLERGVIHTVGQ